MKRIGTLICCLGMVGLFGCVNGPGGGASGGRVAKGKPLRIGVILPLTERFGVFGRAALHGIECAAGLTPPCESRIPITIVQRDSGGTAEGAVKAVRALAQEKVAAIVGPLMASSVVAAAQESQRLRIPMIALSQKSSVAQVGPFIYNVGMTAHSQVEVVAEHAVRKRSLKRVGIFYPKNAYGNGYRELFRQAAQAMGATIVTERPYNPKLGRIIEAHQKAKEGGGDADSLVRRRFRLSREGEVVEVVGANTPLPKLEKISGVDAVFVPDSYRTVIGLLNTFGSDFFDNAVLLGNSRWNNHGILSGGEAVQGAIFVDGFFKGSSNSETQRFVSMFVQAYSLEPTILEAQAYDAVMLLAKAAGRAGRSPARVQRLLQKMGKFHGVTGKMQFKVDGSARKNLFLLTVGKGQIEEVGSRKYKVSSNAPYDGPVASVPMIDSPSPDIRVERTDFQSDKYEFPAEEVQEIYDWEKYDTLF